MALIHVCLSPGFPPEAGFSEEQSHHSLPLGEKLVFRGAICSAQRCFRTPPEHSFPDSELCWSSLHGKGAAEKSYSGVLGARWSKFLFGKSFYLRKFWAKAHTAKRIFKKFTICRP
jgi:hypothetical protein